LDRPELIQQVRFALSRLGDLNGHHDFERICLAFARARITINLLPATGPVSSLGDQGRDGETFWSNLPTEGAVTGNVFGSYLHGPLLPANPSFADALIRLAVERALGEPFVPGEINDKIADQARMRQLRRLVG